MCYKCARLATLISGRRFYTSGIDIYLHVKSVRERLYLDMKTPLLRLVLIIGVTILLLMAGVASAGPRGFAPRRAPPAREAAAPAPRPAEARPPEAQAPGNLIPQQRPGKMTPDERRALRRQIQDDSRSVYRPIPH
jgi:hypothetical protein